VHAPAAGKVVLKIKLEDRVKIGEVIGTVDTSVKVEATPKKEVPIQQTPTPQKNSHGSASFEAIQIGQEAYISSLGQPQMSEKAVQAASQPLALPGERRKMSQLRKTIAKRLVEVKNQTAMLTTFNEVDMTEVMAIRQKEQEEFVKRYGVKLGFMSFFVQACVSALKACPDINAFIDGDDIVLFKSMDIGVAVSTDKGLMVPVIRKAEDLNFGQIEQTISNYSKKAKEGKLAITDLQGGSFTITNGGTFGSMLSTPILNPPQSAILGMHAIQKRAVVVNDQIVIRPMMYLALSYDHRIIDGKEAVTFLVNVKQNIEDPSRLLLDF
jgi:2-oxoglutarate dehydrogenase E2 component (dihydrolipoamide succinyltransferase)